LAIVGDETKYSRRSVLTGGLKTIIGFFVLGFGIPLTGFAISPVVKKGEGSWIPIADLNQVKEGEPVQISYKFSRQDGWMTVENNKTVFVMKRADGSLSVLSNICTHLGCGVKWEANTKQFTCACHGGVYDSEGKVVSGPPPEPLAQLAVKIEENKVYVREA
jgi:Rieske Fe-S protein